jgi:nicotinamide-nucleotide amidase
LSNNLFDKKLIDSIKDRLLKKEETLAVAESVTSGMLQLAFSQADNAIHFFQGGITAYNLGQKSRHLYIDPIRAERCNCVSEFTAQEMAENVCDTFTSDWGIGITGYASAVPESDNKLFAWVAIVYRGELLELKKIIPEKDEPLHVQASFCREVLKMLDEVLSPAR